MKHLKSRIIDDYRIIITLESRSIPASSAEKCVSEPTPHSNLDQFIFNVISHQNDFLFDFFLRRRKKKRNAKRFPPPLNGFLWLSKRSFNETHRQPHILRMEMKISSFLLKEKRNQGKSSRLFLGHFEAKKNKWKREKREDN